MKIIAGFSRIDEIPLLVESGADELYFGVKTILHSNHRPAEFSICADEIKIARKRTNVKLFIAVNQNFVNAEESTQLLKKAFSEGIDGAILADPSLINKFKDQYIILSCVFPVFNKIAAEYMINLGANRITLPRCMTPDDIEEWDFPMEIFHTGVSECRNIDGYCKLHNYNFKKSTCVSWENYMPRIPDPMELIKGFHKKGISTIKLGFREFPTERKVQMTKETRRLVDEL